MTVAQPEVDQFKPLYKQHRHISFEEIQHMPTVLNTRQPSAYHGFYSLGSIDFCGFSSISVDQLPGLYVVPSAVTREEQAWLIRYTLDALVPDKRHKSNLTPFLDLAEPVDLFDDEAKAINKSNGTAVPMAKIRNKQLRWITLGGQYDWTRKVYPSWELGSEGWPKFPKPLADFITKKFPVMTPEAAIVNFYSPGDTLSPHQDVAEKSDAGLISISIGCSCVFYVGQERSSPPLPILLQSGDVIVMSGASRNAFHGVSKVFGSSCPDFAGLISDNHNGWVSSKRLNLNVRQMVDDAIN